jgi:hypothetical protein
MTADEVELGVAYRHISLLQVCASRTNRFDFPAFERDACFEALLDEVVMESFFILDNAHERGSTVDRCYSNSPACIGRFTAASTHA